MRKIVECVPNISEGRDLEKIKKIISVIERNGVKLLDVSSDQNHNRSVITFVGEPQVVKTAAFDLVKKAGEIIDMRNHKGGHPRMGAVDVCPFVPVAGVSMRDCVELAYRLGEEIVKIGLSGYFYEEAAKKPERKNLSDIRRGEYEGLAEKLKKPEWKPDFGPAEFNPKFGAMAVGAREFLVAYNVNLETSNFEFAKEVARIVRCSGDTRIPGIFKTVKAIGVDCRDKGYVQVSMNLTNYKIDPVYVVFEAIKRMAALGGVEVRDSEIVGLVPEDVLKDVSLQYLKLRDFDEDKQIIEKALNL